MWFAQQRELVSSFSLKFNDANIIIYTNMYMFYFVLQLKLYLLYDDQKNKIIKS